jgi:hypothetical protein
MATVKDLYTQEGAKLSKMHTTLTARRGDSGVPILVTMLWHHELAAFYRAYYVDSPSAFRLADVLISLIDVPCFHEGLQIVDGHPAQLGHFTNDHMTESRYTILYINSRMSDSDAEVVQAAYAARGKVVIIRDSRYAEYITAHDTPAAFISHDSRDKDDFARPLAERLAAELVPVWYDEYSNRVGDNLYENLEKGLKVAPKVIVLLSKNFFANTSWARQEFLMAIHRHITNKVLLPVWIDVDVEDVKRYDLMLAGLVALPWPLELEPRDAATHVARKLADVIRPQ